MEIDPPTTDTRRLKNELNKFELFDFVTDNTNNTLQFKIVLNEFEHIDSICLMLGNQCTKNYEDSKLKLKILEIFSNKSNSFIECIEVCVGGLFQPNLLRFSVLNLFRLN